MILNISKALFAVFLCVASVCRAETDFNVYLPEDYDPAHPAGVVVYISPVDSGMIPEDWKPVFDQRNVIWVGVDGSGNSHPVEQRISEAIMSREFVLNNYEIDPQRIYVSGMSGGGQVAGMVAPLYPGLFKGGIFICGVNPWSERADDPWQENPPANIDTMKKNHFVFVSGTEDFKLAATARVYRLYKKAGIDNSRLIVIQDMGHELPDAKTYGNALDYLDKR